MLLQAYDFVHLNQAFGCELQIGGSDQWGNVVAGIDLARRMHGAQLYGMTCPLLTKADGTKMGKTESGAIWLSAEKTSPYEFYQYWLNVDDSDIAMCLRFLTELDREEIDALVGGDARDSKKRLAQETTRLIHGPDGLARAAKASGVLFGGEINDFSDDELVGIFNDVPSCNFEFGRLEGDGLSLIDALVESELTKSKGEARRTIGEGGAYVNNQRHESVESNLTREHLASESMIVLRRGKKKYALLRFS